MNRIGRSRNARINQAIGHATELLATLKRLQGYPMTTHVEDKDAWFDMRTKLESLTQCAHEANAYNNSMQLPEREVVEGNSPQSEGGGL